MLLPEKIKLRPVITNMEKQLLTVEDDPTRDGKNVGMTNDAIDPCTSHHMFFKRVTAMFDTRALVSIKDPGWFSYRDVIDFMDLIEFLAFRLVSGQRAPLQEVFKAYLRIMEILMDQIHTHGKSTASWIKSNQFSWPTNGNTCGRNGFFLAALRMLLWTRPKIKVWALLP